MIKKSVVRNLMSNKRNILGEFLIKSTSLMIAKIAYDYITKNSFKKIAIYMSIKNEVRMEYLMGLIIGTKLDIFLPVCKKGDYMRFSKFEDINLMQKDYLGISCPKNDWVIDEKEIEVFFIPGLAFDAFGNRVGYGKGYFDRTLKNTRSSIFIGVCYDFQFILDDILESDNNDIGMDYILTEKGMHRVNNLQ